MDYDFEKNYQQQPARPRSPEPSRHERDPAKDKKNDQQREAQHRSDQATLEEFKKDHRKPLPPDVRLRLEQNARAQLRAYDAEFQLSKAADKHQQDTKHSEQRTVNERQARELATSVDAAAKRLDPVLAEFKQARAHGKLSADAAHAVAAAVAGAFETELGGAIEGKQASRALAAAISVCRSSHTAETLASHVREIGAHIRGAVLERANDAGESIAAAPSAAKLAAAVERAARQATENAITAHAAKPAAAAELQLGEAYDQLAPQLARLPAAARQREPLAYVRAAKDRLFRPDGVLKPEALSSDERARGELAVLIHEPKSSWQAFRGRVEQGFASLLERDAKHELVASKPGKKEKPSKKAEKDEGAADHQLHQFLSQLQHDLTSYTNAERDGHLALKEQRDEHPVVGGISETAAAAKEGVVDTTRYGVAKLRGKKYKPEHRDADVKMPDLAIWDGVYGHLNAAGAALDAGDAADVEAAKRQLRDALVAYKDCHRRVYEYRSRVEGGAADVATALHGIEIGCDIIVFALSAGSGGVAADIAKVGLKGALKLGAEQAAKSLVKTAVRTAAVTGANKLASGAAGEGAAVAVGLEDHFDLKKVLADAGTEAATNLVGVLVGGALSKFFMRSLGEILASRMSPAELLKFAEKLGAEGAIAPELFVQKGWKFLVGVVGDAATTILMTAMNATVAQLRSGGKLPNAQQFAEMVVVQMIQNGFIQLIFGAITHEPIRKSSATTGPAASERAHAESEGQAAPAPPSATRQAAPAGHHNPEGADPKIASAASAEKQRDPHTANAAAKEKPRGAYRLRGGAGATLEIRGEAPVEVAPQIADFLANELGVERKDISIKPLGGGRSGALVFSVQVHGEDLGVFKVFGDETAAADEIKMLRLLHGKHMEKYKAVGEKGVTPAKTNGHRGGAVLMERATGTSVDDQLKSVPPPGGTGHDEAVVALEASVRSVAVAMAEMHNVFASGYAETVAQKKSDAEFIHGKFEKLKSKMAAGDARAVDDKLRGEIIPEFVKSPVPATAYHGDANIGNFVVDKEFNVHVIDVGTMKHSIDDKGHGKSTGAADVGRFMQSLQASSEGKLTAGEVARVQQAFLDRYFGSMKLSRRDFDAGIKLFRAELEMAAMNKAQGQDELDAAVRRLGSLLGVSIAGRGK